MEQINAEILAMLNKNEMRLKPKIRGERFKLTLHFRDICVITETPKRSDNPYDKYNEKRSHKFFTIGKEVVVIHEYADGYTRVVNNVYDNLPDEDCFEFYIPTKYLKPTNKKYLCK